MATLTKDKLSKRGNAVIYSGLRAKIRVPPSIFTDPKNPPATFEVSGEFAGPREAKPKLTAEERKAARAAKPKPTLAELIAKREAALAKLKAKAEAA